jgi:hypothetical protein
MTSQRLMPARNVGLTSHRPGKLNNSKWPLSKFFRAMMTKTSIPCGHQAMWRHYAQGLLPGAGLSCIFLSKPLLSKPIVLTSHSKDEYYCILKRYFSSVVSRNPRSMATLWTPYSIELMASLYHYLFTSHARTAKFMLILSPSPFSLTVAIVSNVTECPVIPWTSKHWFAHITR